MLSVKQGGIKYHFKVFGMTRPEIELRSPGPLANTLTAGPMSHIPNFKQNIFLIPPTSKDDAQINFERNNCLLIYPNGTHFNITQREHLYNQKNVVPARNVT